MATLNEVKYAAMLNATGATPPLKLNELEHKWLTLQGVTAPGTLSERWYRLFGLATGHWNENAHKWLTAQLVSPGGTLNERFYMFWEPAPGP